MTKIISLFNQAGGVGKTTLTMNLGYALAKKKQKVLLLDLDPQASLTTFMGIEAHELETTIYDCLIDSNTPLNIIKNLHGLDLAPTNINLSLAEMQLVSALNREQRLKKLLSPLTNYDFVLIDCPPSLGILSILALTASTHLLVPIECEFKSYFGTGLLLDSVKEVRLNVNPDLAFAGFVPMKLDKRRSQHLRTYEQMKTELPVLGIVFDPVPDSTVFPDATEERLPLALYKPKHPAIKVINQIAQQLIKNNEQETTQN